MKKKLTHPFMLGLQGFVAGAALFWSAQALNAEPAPDNMAMEPARAEQIAEL